MASGRCSSGSRAVATRFAGPVRTRFVPAGAPTSPRRSGRVLRSGISATASRARPSRWSSRALRARVETTLATLPNGSTHG